MKRKIKAKTLYNKARKIQEKMYSIIAAVEAGIFTQFEEQSPETKKSFYLAVDRMNEFIDNID